MMVDLEFSETLTGPQKSKPTIKNGSVALTRLVYIKFVDMYVYKIIKI